MPATKDQRSRDLAAIHTAKRDLALSDEDYRAMLHQVARVSSAKDLSAQGRTQVLNHLRGLGWTRKPRQHVARRPGTPPNLECSQMLRKIEAQIADMDLSWAYVDAICKRQTRIDRVAWLRNPDQLKAIIAALYVEQEKRALLTTLDQLLKQAGIDHERLTQQFALTGNWQRNRATLRRLIQVVSDRPELIQRGEGQ